MKVHTESVQFKADQKLLDYIGKKMERLERFFGNIINAEVKLRLENSGQVRDKVAEIRIFVPGQNFFAKETDKSFEAAVLETVSDLRRQLERHKEKNLAHNGANLL